MCGRIPNEGLLAVVYRLLIVKYDTRFGRSGVILLIFAGECLGVVPNLKQQSAVVNTCESGLKSLFRLWDGLGALYSFLVPGRRMPFEA